MAHRNTSEIVPSISEIVPSIHEIFTPIPEVSSVNPVIDDVIDNGNDEEFLESIQYPGLHYSNLPHRPVSIPKNCLALSPPKTKVKAKVPQESQRVSSRAKKVIIKYGNNVGYQ